MKDKKNKKTTPVIKTENTAIPGSVGEFIELLKQFPSDGKFDLNGMAQVDVSELGKLENGATLIKIYPNKQHEYTSKNCIINECDCDNNHECLCTECTCKNNECVCAECASDQSNENRIMQEYLTGIAYNNNKFLNDVREASSDMLISANVMIPNEEELKFESDLHPYQNLTIDEIRVHNMHIAERLGELHRREVAAILEYTTQCMARLADATNVDMCEIISEDNK